MINYDKFLDEWAEEVYKKMDKAQKDIEDTEIGSFKYGKLKGFIDGLCTSLALLSTIERKERIKNKNEI